MEGMYSDVTGTEQGYLEPSQSVQGEIWLGEADGNAEHRLDGI